MFTPRIRKRFYTRERDEHIVRKQILVHLKNYGPTTYTRLMFVAELNSIHMLKYIADMQDAKLIRVIPINNGNLSKYTQYVNGTTKKLIVITKKGLNILNMIEEMPVIDFSARGSRRRKQT